MITDEQKKVIKDAITIIEPVPLVKHINGRLIKDWSKDDLKKIYEIYLNSKVSASKFCEFTKFPYAKLREIIINPEKLNNSVQITTNNDDFKGCSVTTNHHHPSPKTLPDPKIKNLILQILNEVTVIENKRMWRYYPRQIAQVVKLIQNSGSHPSVYFENTNINYQVFINFMRGRTSSGKEDWNELQECLKLNNELLFDNHYNQLVLLQSTPSIIPELKLPDVIEQISQEPQINSYKNKIFEMIDGNLYEIITTKIPIDDEEYKKLAIMYFEGKINLPFKFVVSEK